MESLPWAAAATLAMLLVATPLLARVPDNPDRTARRVLLNRLIRPEIDS